jgi:predicted Na+-dependent transporter
MTAVSTVMSIAMLPFNLLLYTRLSYESDVLQDLNWTSLVIAMIVVISAIGLGIFSSSHFNSHQFNLTANKVGNGAGILLILFSAILSNVGGGGVRIWNRSWEFYLGVALPCLMALILSNLITTWLQLKKPERVTTSIECCYQNVGIATSIALAMYNGQEQTEAVGVPFYYGVVEAVLVGMYCMGAWKYGWTKAPADVSFWTMISTSYEVLTAEQEDGSKSSGTEMIPPASAASVENKTVKSSDNEEDLVTSYVQV